MSYHLDKKSKCYQWLLALESLSINEFWYRDLPDNLKDPSCFQKSIERNLLIPIDRDNRNAKKWQINLPSTSKRLKY